MEAVPSSVFSSLIPVLKTHNRKTLPTIFSVKSMATTEQKSVRRRERTIPMSPFEARLSLVGALASQTASLSPSVVRMSSYLASEIAKFVFPSKRFETRNLEDALMSVPDLETVEFKVLNRNDQYEIREVESFFIAETTMPGNFGFDFSGASQSFSVLAGYLFGKNTKAKQMEMTTPVFTRRVQSEGTKIKTTPLS